MPIMKDPAKIADKQIRRLTDSVPDIEAGVALVTESPTAKAAARLDIAKANFARAVDSGKMARNLKAVSLEEWKAKTLAKVGRIPEGISESRDTLIQFHEQRNAHQAVIDRELAGIEKRTLADGIRRMTVQVQQMAKFSFDKSK